MEKRQWIRLYTKLPGDPKIQRLPGDLFKFWINCLCLAGTNCGILPKLADIAWTLRLSESDTLAQLRALATQNLVHEIDQEWVIHDWEEHQFESDFSRERMNRYRQRHYKRHRDGDSDGDMQRNSDAVAQNRTEQNRTEQKQAGVVKTSSTPGAATAAAPARAPACLPENEKRTGPNGAYNQDWLQPILEKAIEGIELLLPPMYLENEFGRKDRNPAYVALYKLIENARERIRRSRKPVAYLRTLIMDELGIEK